MEVKNTRLRYIRASNIQDLVDAISSLPFKVELKTLVKDGTRWVQTFVIPDNVKEFESIDL